VDDTLETEFQKIKPCTKDNHVRDNDSQEKHFENQYSVSLSAQ
jgi:hypothetical protein